MIFKEQERLLETPWNEAWASPAFRRNFLTASIIFAAILLLFPFFFAAIQKRKGVILNDWLLNILPSVDVSVYIFSLIYIIVCIGIYRAAQSPVLFLNFLWACILLSIARMTTILLVPLEPPIGLIPLVDPVLRPFYGHDFITKDLFFSGHTSSLFLIFMVMKKNWEKAVVLIATILLAILLLLQHIHYLIDVAAAPVFVYIVFVLAKRISNFSFSDV